MSISIKKAPAAQPEAAAPTAPTSNAPTKPLVKNKAAPPTTPDPDPVAPVKVGTVVIPHPMVADGVAGIAEPHPTQQVDKPKKQVAKTAVATTTMDYGDGTQTEEVEKLGEVLSSEPMAEVHVGVGLTRSIGKYEFVRFDVSLTIPCAATETDINDTYAEAKAWVDARITEIDEEVHPTPEQ